MLGAMMATRVNPEKRVDLPPRGGRNADPITDAAGSHPIETGIGAAVAGAATGIAAGAVAGPVGAAIGAAVGAVAGGYVGKDVGEIIDPTTEDNWLRDNFESRPYVRPGDTFEKYRPAYKHGAVAESLYGGTEFDSIESRAKEAWDKLGDTVDYPWPEARGAVKDSYDRTCQLRAQRAVPAEPLEVMEDEEVLL
jgi:hypothetical protein